MWHWSISPVTVPPNFDWEPIWFKWTKCVCFCSTSQLISCEFPSLFIMTFSILCTTQGSIFVQEHYTNRRVAIIEVALFLVFQRVFFPPLCILYILLTHTMCPRGKRGIHRIDFFSLTIPIPITELGYWVPFWPGLFFCFFHEICTSMHGTDLDHLSSCKITWHYNYILLITYEWKKAEQKTVGAPSVRIHRFGGLIGIDRRFANCCYRLSLAIVADGCAASASLGGNFCIN